MSRQLKVIAAAVLGFIIPAAVIVLIWATASGPASCIGDECALEFAAVMTAAIVTGALVAAASGFVAYALTGGRNDDAQ